MYKMLMICKNMQNIQSKPIIKKFRSFSHIGLISSSHACLQSNFISTQEYFSVDFIMWFTISIFSNNWLLRFRQCTVYSFICAYPVNLIDKNNCRRKIIDKGNQLTRIYFSESPLHLLTNELAVMLKKVHWHSVATAFANIVFLIS
ncbi:uncharacterized protein LOC126927051 [Bombus affinis]|uniref:uncharacterized protein LOC126927051 n=1 Tax=Bombus affinis TaxID=309941 RepID=UPI0021B81B7E|nr:uncharacterized protein LOC126927051 [Bombus affinis]